MKASRARKTFPLRLKRAYESAAEDDGLRVLVDRLWPRGLTKAKANIDLWLKDVAPSDALRRKIHADPRKWPAFVVTYRRELEHEPASTAAATLRAHWRTGPVTLLYASRNEARNNAVVLKEWLETNDGKQTRARRAQSNR
jgi:uncharacterized protein YeaO (DUF488 family)